MPTEVSRAGKIVEPPPSSLDHPGSGGSVGRAAELALRLFLFQLPGSCQLPWVVPSSAESIVQLPSAPGKDNRVAVMPTYRQDVRTRSYCQSHPRRDAALSRRPSSAIRLSHACSLFAYSNEAGDVVRSLRFTGVINFLECALGLFECADTPRAVYLSGLRVEGSRRRHADES